MITLTPMVKFMPLILANYCHAEYMTYFSCYSHWGYAKSNYTWLKKKFDNAVDVWYKAALLIM